MQKYVHIFLFLLILSTNVILGKSVTKTKNNNCSHKKHFLKGKSDNDRIKRSLYAETIPFWPNRGKKQIDNDQDDSIFKNDLEHNNQKLFNENEKLLKETPFWGNRGRRDGLSLETINLKNLNHRDKYCEHCSEITQSSKDYNNIMDRTSRGRWSSEEIEGMAEPFLSNMRKIQEKEPFWGNRGRRTEDNISWGNREGREDEPFWGTRGRRENNKPLWNSHGMMEDQEPFWGNRGRRQETEPFWGNRGRRDEDPFWGNRGKRKIYDWTNQNKKEKLKGSIINTMFDVETDLENLLKLKKGNIETKSFWGNSGRDSSLKLLFNGPIKNSIRLPKYERSIITSDPGTVLDNRMYVEEPNYILVERSSRSSAEDDPYYVSRGKKYYYRNSLINTLRDRRGALEKIVKSVRNDPYNIARGKKDVFDVNNVNSTIVHGEYIKVKDLICSAIDLFMIKYKDNNLKREINDIDRDRRTILKKLAAQLQMDPYFVSRGKKSEILISDDHLQEFISNVADKCN